MVLLACLAAGALVLVPASAAGAAEQKISISVDQLCRNADGSNTAVFGYFNRNAYPITIPYGPNNRIALFADNAGQPTVFQPGRAYAVFPIVYPAGQVRVWALSDPNGVWGGSTSTGGTASADCRPDVSLSMSADRASATAGDLITYTLTVHNAGPGSAAQVKIHDHLPAGLALVSVSVPCTTSADEAECDLGTLAHGADRVVTLVARAKGSAPATGPAAPDHQLTVTKQETALAIPSGATGTNDLTCPAGGAMADGSVEVMHVDQGAGTPADVQVLEADSVARGTYRFTVRNPTGGPAQVKLFGSCLPATTDAGGTEVHAITVGDPVTTTTGVLAPGRYTFTLPTDAAHVAVAPGLKVLSGVARLVGGQSSGSGWTFTVEVLQAAQLTLSVRPLATSTGAAGSPSHVHALTLHHVTSTPVIPAGESVQRVGCPVGDKGILATYGLPAGVVPLGNEPQPVNRDVRLLNTTGAPVAVALGLQCLSVTTAAAGGGETVTLVNTATVETSSDDPDASDDAASVSVDVARRPGTGDDRAARGAARLTAGGAVAGVPVRCRSAAVCAGSVRLSAVLRPRRSRARTVVLGRARFRLAPHAVAVVRVPVAARYRAAVRAGRVHGLHTSLR